MTPLKRAIFTELRNSTESAASLVQLDDLELNQLVFHHPDGLRLSLSGFVIIKKLFTAYSFDIPETIKTKHHFGMSKMEYPYFLTPRRLILFSEMDAMVVKLRGGIESFLESYSQFD
jgi:hypothetical protein